MVGRWKRSGVSPMSMALTLAPLRRRTPRTNRGISTILTGRFRGGFANVSAVDTGLPSASAQRGSRGAARRPHPRFDPTGPCSAPDRGLEVVVRRRLRPGACESRPYSTRGGIHWPRLVRPARRPPYLEYPHPSSSSTRASRIATRRRRTPPDLPRAASPPLSVGHAAAIGGSVSRPFEGPAPEEDSPLVPGSSLKPRRSRDHLGGTGGVIMRGFHLSLTLECVPRRT